MFCGRRTEYSPKENHVIITVHKPESLEFCLEIFGSDCGDEPDCSSLAASIGDLAVVFMECECR